MTTCKQPVPQSFPQADGSYTRNFCMADACGNVYSVCETYTLLSGAKTVDTLLIDGQAATSIPAEWVPSDCPQKVYVVNQPRDESAIDREMQILCAPDGTRVVIQNVTPADAPLGTAPTFEAWNLDGTPWVGAIGSLVACNGSKLESDPQIMCHAGVTFLRHFVKSEGEPTGIKFDTTLAGSPYVVTDESLVSPGECKANSVQLVSSATADDISTLGAGTSFAVYKPDCCVLQLVTSVGTIVIPKTATAYSTQVFKEPFTVDAVNVLSGTCDPESITLISNLSY